MSIFNQKSPLCSGIKEYLGSSKSELPVTVNSFFTYSKAIFSDTQCRTKKLVNIIADLEFGDPQSEVFSCSRPPLKMTPSTILNNPPYNTEQHI